ncbi:hypothetical protein SAMN05421738_1085 [Algoriella xinjiangensis]|uniref:Uncharacterized protein n=1 Tax=Algoriella xinjiangensis TaxID=684065 RepID=A0A1I4X1D6_9FLAO|nr:MULTISPECIES: hypothetical protein [Algoriella]MBO6213230.1 hypothetical protein [Algoriella sp.]SFN19263.1 hypothetical protein SAMN05421738_1085 [Algoriella xinjiangensis]VDH14663.1 Uncharacterised protein [Algoriella xinjiangensis]
MNNYLVKHIVGIFFSMLLMFSTNLQGLAGYIDYTIKLEEKANHDSDKKDSKALFSQTSTEEENNQKNNSSKEITEKIQYFHQINLFTFFDAKQKSFSNYYHSDDYTSTNNGVTTPPPEFI